jgi:hypothetical protein
MIIKSLIAILILALFGAGCSQKKENSSITATTAAAADLGKDANYFSNLYGPANSRKSANEYDFSLPSVGHLIRLNGPFVINQYASGKLNVTVIFLEATAQAIWVKYTLPNPWTQEQIKAALGAYDNKWTAADQSLGLTLIMQDRAPVMYQSNSKIFAYKTMVNELMIYSPALFQGLRNKLTDEEQQKREVPKF